jgi:hypothetical protein
LINKNILGVVLFMYKEPKDTAKVIEAGEIFGIGEFLLVSYFSWNTDFNIFDLVCFTRLRWFNRWYPG